MTLEYNTSTTISFAGTTSLNQARSAVSSDEPPTNPSFLICSSPLVSSYRVVFSPNSEARNGDFVLARLRRDEAVLFKQFHREGKNGEVVRLVSLNPNYDQVEHPAQSFRFLIPGVSRLTIFRH